MNQKVPMSSMVPNKDTACDFEKRAESKTATTTPRPARSDEDLGKLIFPSKNRARLQKIKQKTTPTTSKSPFEVSIGMLVKGMKKIGNNVITKNSDKKDNLSNVFECICFLL